MANSLYNLINEEEFCLLSTLTDLCSKVGLQKVIKRTENLNENCICFLQNALYSCTPVFYMMWGNTGYLLHRLVLT